GRFRVGWVGRLRPEKGADVLLAALPLLADLPLVVSVVGEGRQRPQLQQSAARLGLGDRVRWLGNVAEAGRLFAGFDVFALSSRTEGTPIVLFEAMAARTPIVASAVGGVPDVVSPREALLIGADDPAALRQIRVVSDDSTDQTDAIVREYAGCGVELLRLPRRAGKTAAENAAVPLLRGDIIVTTDASVRPQQGALKPLIASFADPTVGVASGHYVSVARAEGRANHGESWYVGYDMWVRLLETRVAGIPGAAGCFHAVRAPIHLRVLPEDISRDFAAALLAREHGLRAVSVESAV